MDNNQLNIMVGSLLGDGCLVMGKRNRNARFKLKQCARFKSYVEYVRCQLGELSCDHISLERSRKPSKLNGKVCNDISNWNGEYCEAWYMWTKCNDDLTELWRRWYPNGKKIIPSDISLNKQIVSHWFVQDGCNNVSDKAKQIVLCANGFSNEDVELLARRLHDDCAIESSICKGPIIRISAVSYFSFINMVSDEVKSFGCFDYKIDTTGAPTDRKGEVWRKPKITLNVADEIREVRKMTGMKLKDIAAKYGISTSSVGKIVNFQMYEHKQTRHIGGEAIVKMGLKYGN